MPKDARGAGLFEHERSTGPRRPDFKTGDEPYMMMRPAQMIRFRLMSIESKAKGGGVSDQAPEDALCWRLQCFDDFTPVQLYAVLAARVAVFVVEQDCPYQDLDGLDGIGLHLGGWAADESIAAYARILPPGTRFSQPSIGRVLTTARVRRTGVGRELMARAIAATREKFPGEPIRISAQRYLETFYGRFGFTIDSAPYDEDGIPHVEMVLGNP